MKLPDAERYHLLIFLVFEIHGTCLKKFHYTSGLGSMRLGYSYSWEPA